MNDFDWRNPDYDAVFNSRMDRLRRLRAKPELVTPLKVFYKENPAKFISDWGTTFDPRNAERNLPTVIPFILFDKQTEWIDWVIDHWRSQKPGLTEKTRDMGVSWLSISLSCWMCLFFDGVAIGFGSRKEEYVDKGGAPKSLFFKARMFLQYLPREFRGGWDLTKHAPHMRILFPESGSVISGESGDNIGRGDRASIYFVDEAAFLEKPQLVDNALSQTTNCQMDISTPNGLGNMFAEKRHNGKVDVFTFHWRDHPAKDDAWYAKQEQEMTAVALAQEVNIDYAASVEGVLIPSVWVQSAIDAHIKLNFPASGARTGSLDVADEGRDDNAFVGRYGVVLDHAEQWSGKDSDILSTVHRAFRICDDRKYEAFKYDADGLGAGVRGDARVVNESRPHKIMVEAFRGSAAVFRPESQDEPGRKNQDFFLNCKAQAWWALRQRFQRTHRAVTGEGKFHPDELISIPANLPMRSKLIGELSQPTFRLNLAGKIVVDKAPDGTKSPNLADATMMEFATVRSVMRISPEALARSARG